jgi:hypothetical protein
MPLRAQRLHDVVVERHVLPTRRQTHRIEVVHAAAQCCRLYDVLRQAEGGGLVGGERDAGEMAAGPLTRDVEALGVGTEACRIGQKPFGACAMK